MHRPSARSSCLLAVAALAAGGCGNSDDPAPPVTATAPSVHKARLTKQAYARASAKICARGDRAISAFIPLGTDPTTRRANRAGVIETLRRQNEDLHALGAPAGAPSRVFDDVYRSVGRALDRAAKDETADIEKEIDLALRPYGETLAKYTPDCG
jgi:hypothetical protein